MYLCWNLSCIKWPNRPHERYFITPRPEQRKSKSHFVYKINRKSCGKPRHEFRFGSSLVSNLTSRGQVQRNLSRLWVFSTINTLHRRVINSETAPVRFSAPLGQARYKQSCNSVINFIHRNNDRLFFSVINRCRTSN